MDPKFFADAMGKADRRRRQWYQENFMRVLQAAKEGQQREIDASIALAEELLKILNEPVPKPVVVPMPVLIPTDEDAVMKPVEEEVRNILIKSEEKGAGERYLKERYKKAPEDKFLYRVCGNWDYGWMQKHAKQRSRDVNYGRCFAVRHTFYRKNNLAPDPSHYSQPAGGEVSICGEYSCSNN